MDMDTLGLAALFATVLLTAGIIVLAVWKRDTLEYLADLIGTRLPRFSFMTGLLIVAAVIGVIAGDTLYGFDWNFYKTIAPTGHEQDFQMISVVIRTVAIMGLPLAVEYFHRGQAWSTFAWGAFWTAAVFLGFLSATGFVAEEQENKFKGAYVGVEIARTDIVTAEDKIDLIETNISQINASITENNSIISSARADKASAQANLSSIVNSVSAAMANVTEDGLDNDVEALEAGNTAVAEAQRAAAGEIDRLDALIAKAQAEIQSLRSDAEGERSKLATSKDELAAAKQDLIGAQNSAEPVEPVYTRIAGWLGYEAPTEENPKAEKGFLWVTPVGLRDTWSAFIVIFMEAYLGVVLALVWAHIRSGKGVNQGTGDSEGQSFAEKLQEAFETDDIEWIRRAIKHRRNFEQGIRDKNTIQIGNTEWARETRDRLRAYKKEGLGLLEMADAIGMDITQLRGVITKIMSADEVKTFLIDDAIEELGDGPDEDDETNSETQDDEIDDRGQPPIAAE